MLLNELLPTYDVVERHRTLVHAAPARVYAAIRSADLTSGAVTRLLLAIRTVPAALIAVVRSPRAAQREWRDRRAGRSRRATTLADLERAGFRVVGERAPEELVLGLLGKFWTPRGGVILELSATTFTDGLPSGYALAGWNFTVAPRPGGWSELRTETRVRCAPDARTRFRAYWLLVRPGSGLIRRAMLAAIRREAEREG